MWSSGSDVVLLEEYVELIWGEQPFPDSLGLGGSVGRRQCKISVRCSHRFV